MLLQSGGLINRALLVTNIIDQPLVMVFNRLDVHISMTHITLPFIVLPLYAVMKGISPNYVRAAILLFLIVQVLVIVPLSFNARSFLSYPLTGFRLFSIPMNG